MFGFKGGESPTASVNESNPQGPDTHVDAELDSETEQASAELQQQVEKAEDLLHEFTTLSEDAFARQEVSNRIGRAVANFLEGLKSMKPIELGVTAGLSVGTLFAALNLTGVSDSALLDFTGIVKPKLTEREMVQLPNEHERRVAALIPMNKAVVNELTGFGSGLVLGGGVEVLLKIVEAVRKKKEDLPESA